MKISMNNVLNAAKKIPTIFAFGIVGYICSLVENEHNYYYEEDINPTYGFNYMMAFDSIIGSNMLDSNKMRLINTIRKDADSDYYESVCKILESNMLISNKIRTIEALSR